jgi:F420-non-reducing hydrogenase large subunit
MVRHINLIVATQINAAAIQLSLVKAARKLLTANQPTDAASNSLEMVFRAYDPCMACATH